MLLEAKNVTKKFGDLTVLNQVSLSVSAGDFVSIIGKSGSGKSTLLTILGGIDRPTEGEVLLNGVDIAQLKEKDLARLRRTELGFVFQFFNLAPYLTAKENILLPIILDGKGAKSKEAELKELCDYLGISALLNKLPAKMSGGEQQRVAIARGLIFSPKLILLDEPTGNLDSKSSEEIMRLLRRVNEERGTTVIQVTHSTHNAGFGNRIILIEDGSISGQEIEPSQTATEIFWKQDEVQPSSAGANSTQNMTEDTPSAGANSAQNMTEDIPNAGANSAQNMTEDNPSAGANSAQNMTEDTPNAGANSTQNRAEDTPNAGANSPKNKAESDLTSTQNKPSAEQK